MSKERQSLAAKLAANVDELVKIDEDESSDEAIDETVNIDRNVSNNNSESDVKNEGKSVINNDSVNVSKDGNIIFKKESRDEGLERVSFYMKPSTYKKLKKVSKQSDMGISEFHQKLLENILDKIIIKE